MKERLASAAREDWPPEHVEHGRAEHDPDEDLAEHRGLVNARRQRARDLRRGDDQRQQQKDLQGVSQAYASVTRDTGSGRTWERGLDPAPTSLLRPFGRIVA